MLGWLDANDALVERFAAPPPIWPEPELPWVGDLEAAVPAIRKEVLRYLALRQPPETDELIGARSVVDDPYRAVPSGRGSWRILLLQSFGRPVAGVADQFPDTLAAVGRSPLVGNIGFTCLDPGSRIEPHRDLNRGVLRLQLPILLPADAERCWLLLGGTRVRWEEGRCVLFDQCVTHEAVNDTDEPRVVLTAEVVLPLPFPLSLGNRVAQHAYRRLPSYEGMVERAADAARRPLEAAS